MFDRERFDSSDELHLFPVDTPARGKHGRRNLGADVNAAALRGTGVTLLLPAELAYHDHRDDDQQGDQTQPQ